MIHDQKTAATTYCTISYLICIILILTEAF